MPATHPPTMPATHPSAVTDARADVRRTARRFHGIRSSLLLLPALALTGLAATACAEDAGGTAANLPPIPTALPKGLPTALPTAIPTAVPTAVPTAHPTTAPAGDAGTPVGFDGELIQPSDVAVESDAGPDAPCRNIVDQGWSQVSCDAAGSYYWFVERRGAVGEQGTGWQAFLATFDTSRGSWVKLLAYADPSGQQMTAISGRTASLSSKEGNVVFAFRNQGTGQILSYDILGVEGDPTVLAHRDVAHGEATLDGPTILDSEAEYPNGEPNCCPAYFQQSRVSWRDSDGQFVVTPVARDNDQPQGDF